MGFSWKRSKKMAFTKMALFGDKVFNLSDEVFVVEYPPGFSGTRILPPGTEVRLISGVGGSETPGHHGYKGYGSDEGGCLALGRASDGWMRNPHRGSLGNGLRSTGR